MPAGFPSSFASAAAGNGSDQSSRRSLNRGDSLGSSEWARRPNGSTQTFRRPSLATTNSHMPHAREGTAASGAPTTPASSSVYVPPHANSSRNGAPHEARYTRSHLLDLFKQHKAAGDLYDEPSELYIGDYEQDNAATAMGRWSRKEEALPDPSLRPDACLNHSANTEPLGLVQMNAEERELFATSVNSPVKAPNPSAIKEPGQREGTAARKMSMGLSNPAGGVNSPASSRPTNRRREPSESFSRESLTSPVVKTRPSVEDQELSMPPTLLRRRTDGKEFSTNRNLDDVDADDAPQPSDGAFGFSRRISSGPLSAGLAGAQSPWSQSQNSAFGSFSHPNGAGVHSRRPVTTLSRGESRFKGLMNRDSVDTATSSIPEKASHGSLAKSAAGDERSDLSTDAYLTGSAALGGAHDEEAQDHHQPRNSKVQSFLGSEQHPGRLTGDDNGHDFNPAGQALRSAGDHGTEPLSPTFTNPYQSPEREASRLNDMAGDDLDLSNLHLPGLGSIQNDGSMSAGVGRMGSAFDARPFERAQTFSPVVSRGFPGLGGIGGLPAVGSPTGWGTPVRERHLDGFGDTSFRHEGASQPSLQGLGSVGSYAGPNRAADRPGSMLGSSRLGSLFPSAMQEQIRGSEASAYLRSGGIEGDRADETYEPQHQRAPGHALNLGGAPPREIDSPFHGSRGADLASPSDGSPVQGIQRGETSQFGASKPRAPDTNQQPGSVGIGASAQPPAAQQKTMVMPDRIRWIYRDPQGHTQGPWSGLEMHDWYRAGFFSPELLVKKVEDPDYEPLAQLIRRIGNSREPFLVPQIGIPGPPSSAAPTTWPGQVTRAPGPASGAQPPFASSFPTFGTTLTAEQQNALERRKQEEQYLMARQKEHLAQQQVYHKIHMQNQALHGMHNQPLQHHSSAQSLQSQQSYGSMTSQPVFQQAIPSASGQAPNAAAFDGSFRQPISTSAGGNAGEALSHIEEEDDMPRRHELVEDAVGRRHGDSGFAQDEEQDRAVSLALADRSRLAREQQRFSNTDAGLGQDEHGGQDRLDEFHSLQDIGQSSDETGASARGHLQTTNKHAQVLPSETRIQDGAVPKLKPQRGEDRGLTLTEQVQQAASAQKSPAATGTQSPWQKTDKPLAESHPASQTSSPLPAPAARRSGGQSVADALAADTASQRNSPAVETPTTSLAPWARDSAETQKQPSLKEIQEAEARRAAKQEEVAAALRRAALEKEVVAQSAPAPAPGLPSSSTWASADTTTSPSVSGPAPWSKGNATKTSTSNLSSAKKTLQQIQKEEEALAKRQKALAASASASNANNPSSGTTAAAQAISAGKRYADLAGRTAGSGAPPSSAWTTVGAGGKLKGSVAGANAVPAPLNRSASGSAASGVLGASKPKTLGSASRTVSSSAAPGLNAQDEFKRWAVGELRADLKKGIMADEFVGSLQNLPMDTDLITEAVHSASSTIDSRHFAEEFVKRRALADKGKTQPPSGSSALNQPATEGKGAGGWSEVASRKPAASKEETSGFKIVPSKKKGGRR